INYMGTLTISLDDDVEKKLRDLARRMHGSRKGGLSKVIENALENYFASVDRSVNSCVTSFKALKEGAVVAEANTLDELASILREKRIEPRGLRIVSSKPIRPVAHGGYRIKPS
ncbi:MAG: hypothetical protein ACUVQ8_08170, partial [Nitrososphaeria archaeon]